MNGIGPENLKIDELIKRINNKLPKEIILATNPTLEGEATSMYLSNFIKDNYKDIKKVKEFYLEDAINQLAKGKRIKVSETKPVGCSIKRFRPDINE